MRDGVFCAQNSQVQPWFHKPQALHTDWMVICDYEYVITEIFISVCERMHIFQSIL